MLRIIFAIMVVQISLLKLSAQIIGPIVVEYNSNAIYFESHTGKPGTYYWKVIGGKQLDGATQTQVTVKWDQSEYGRVEKWNSTLVDPEIMNDKESQITHLDSTIAQTEDAIIEQPAGQLVYALAVTVQNLPIIEYSYDSAGNRTNRRIIYLNSTQLKKSYKSEEDNEVINERLGDIKVSIYPNPTDRILEITTSGLDPNSKSSIAIYTMNGTQIQHLSPVGYNNILDLSEQPDGAYILILTANNEITRWKIIKQ